MQRRHRGVLLGLGALLVVITLGGCDPFDGIVFTNETSGEITVFVADDRTFTVKAGGSETYLADEDSWQAKVVTVTDDAGEVVFEELLTWQDLERRDFKIVIAAN